MKTVSNEHLRQLASTLADWVDGHDSFVIYLFGSRVRGDYRPDSDVDVVVRWERPTGHDVNWWLANNEEDFASINAKLPGRLRILEYTDPLSDRIIGAARHPTYRDRNVVCVWLPPKTFSP